MYSEVFMITFLVVVIVSGIIIMKLNKNVADKTVEKLNKNPIKISKLRSLLEH